MKHEFIFCVSSRHSLPWGVFHEILTSPSLPLVLCTFLRASSSVGIIKTIGIYLEDINISIGTTPTDIGIALGLLNAFCHFPGEKINLNYYFCDHSNPLPNYLLNHPARCTFDDSVTQ